MWEEGDDVHFGWECGVWCFGTNRTLFPQIEQRSSPRKIVLSSWMLMAKFMVDHCPVGVGRSPIASVLYSTSLLNLGNYSIKCNDYGPFSNRGMTDFCNFAVVNMWGGW